MTHACACCPLRFAHASELAAHVRDEHAVREPFVERHEGVPRQRWLARAQRLPAAEPETAAGRRAGQA